MRNRGIKSGKDPVGVGVSANLYATVNPRPTEPGSRLQEAAPPAGPKAAPARETGGAAIAARLPPCPRSAAAGSSEVVATSWGMYTFCPAPQSEAYHLPMGFWDRAFFTMSGAFPDRQFRFARSQGQRPRSAPTQFRSEARTV